MIFIFACIYRTIYAIDRSTDETNESIGINIGIYTLLLQVTIVTKSGTDINSVTVKVKFINVQRV